LKIAVAQIESDKGNLQKNISVHMLAIHAASKENVDLILFPELSLTGYYPEFAKMLAEKIDGALLEPFQEFSNNHNIHIGIGMPIHGNEKPRIAINYFSPDQKNSIYAKQILHEDEFEFFEAGTDPSIWDVKGVKVCPAICYESMKEEHNAYALSKEVNVYAACVAKSVTGMMRSHKHYAALSKDSKMMVLVSNFVGPHGHFNAGGRTAIWNSRGDCVVELDDKVQGLLIWDTDTMQHILLSFDTN